jgi:hypothetical protein
MRLRLAGRGCEAFATAQLLKLAELAAIRDGSDSSRRTAAAHPSMDW